MPAALLVKLVVNRTEGQLLFELTRLYCLYTLLESMESRRSPRKKEILLPYGFGKMDRKEGANLIAMEIEENDSPWIRLSVEG